MVNYKKNTTIVISKEMRGTLQKLKDHPNQSCEEVIDKAIKISGALLVKDKKEEDKKDGK